MKKIKILHILSDTNIGGAGRLLYNLSKSINKSKFEFSFAFPKKSLLCDLFKGMGKIYRISGTSDQSFSISSLSSLYHIIKSEKPDIIHTHSSIVGRLAGVLCGIDKEHIVYTKHCVFDIKKSATHKWRRIIYRTIDNMLAGRIVAVADAAKRELILRGVEKNKITVIINGVLPLKAYEQNQRDRIKNQLGIEKNTFVVGMVARLEKYKGHKTFIDAAAHAKKNGENIRFIIIGDGSCREELIFYANSLGLADQVTFTGFTDNVEKYMNILDLNINCSVGTETSSLSISEGLSIGVPAVVSNFGGNPNMVKDNITGRVFPKNSAYELYKIISSLKKAPNILKIMGNNAQKDYIARFSAEHMAREYERFYFSIL